MHFFTQNYTRETARKKIELTKQLLMKIDDEDKAIFLEMLQQRINEFETALQENQDPAEEDQIIQQYNRFTKTVHLCISRPKTASFYIGTYQNFRYYPVGINDTPTPDLIRRPISLTGAIFGAALILASCVAFAFNPLIGAILLPIGIAILALSCASLFLPDSPDTSSKKTEEKIIFETGAKLIDPLLTFDEMPEYDEQRQLEVL
jgi:hypothetical protein